MGTGEVDRRSRRLKGGKSRSMGTGEVDRRSRRVEGREK